VEEKLVENEDGYPTPGIGGSWLKMNVSLTYILLSLSYFNRFIYNYL
jgi:hypothetical protein